MNMGDTGSRVVGCPRCKRYYRVKKSAAERPNARLRCTACGYVFELPRSRPKSSAGPQTADARRILVATDGSELRSLVEAVLMQGGYACRSVEGGDEAWEQIGLWKPEAAVLDVGLPGMPVFEICDRVRRDPKHRRLGIVLLASVYQHTRYKRSPTSLYGADDYIEKHHLRDSLTLKIARLIPQEGATSSPQEGHYPPPLREEARRGDKVLPSPKEMARDETALTQEVASEIEEGRRLFRTRLKSKSDEGMELYTQAIEEFIARQRARFSSPGESEAGGISG
jgi:CheY-like chemotaxis protein